MRTTDFTWTDVLLWRMERQHLAGNRGESVEGIVKALTTVPSWTGDAELSVGLRLSDPVREGVSAAFEQGRLVKTFAFRGATHYFAPEDVGTYLALRSIGRQWELRSWREFYSLEARDWTALREVVRDALAEGPLTQPELAGVVSSERRFGHLGKAMSHKSLTFLKPLAWQGDLSLAPSSDGRVVLQSLESVHGFHGLPDTDEAGPRAILSYLGAYGPASVDNLLYWFGEGLSAGRKNILKWAESLVGNEVVEIEVEGAPVLVRADQLEELARPRVTGVVRLLPGLDQWVLGPGTADGNVVPALHRAEISREANFVLVDGRISGTWKIAKNELVVSAFGTAPIPRAQVETEALRIGATVRALLGVRVE